MSQYTYQEDGTTHLTVGWNLIRASFSGQVGEQGREMRPFVSGDEEAITRFSWLDEQLASFRRIPASLQPHLLHDRRVHHPAAKSPDLLQFQRDLESRKDGPEARYSILIAATYGWQTRYISRLPADEQERRRALQALLAGYFVAVSVVIQQMSVVLPQGYTTVLVLVDQLGIAKRLAPPVFIEPDFCSLVQRRSLLTEIGGPFVCTRECRKNLFKSIIYLTIKHLLWLHQLQKTNGIPTRVTPFCL